MKKEAAGACETYSILPCSVKGTRACHPAEVRRRLLLCARLSGGHGWQGGPGRLVNCPVHVIHPHLGHPWEAVVAALMASAVYDVPVEVPHLHSGIPEGCHSDGCARKDIPRSLVMVSLQPSHPLQLCCILGCTSTCSVLRDDTADAEAICACIISTQEGLCSTCEGALRRMMARFSCLSRVLRHMGRIHPYHARDQVQLHCVGRACSKMIWLQSSVAAIVPSFCSATCSGLHSYGGSPPACHCKFLLNASIRGRGSAANPGNQG